MLVCHTIVPAGTVLLKSKVPLKDPKNFLSDIYPWLSKTKPKIKNRQSSGDVVFYDLSIRIFGEECKSKLTFVHR